MNQVDAFKNLYLKTIESTSLLNYVLLLMAGGNHPSKINGGLKELNDSIGYIKILLQNRKRATKIDNFVNIFDQAIMNNFCSNACRKEILFLVNKNNITDLLDDLIEKCVSFEISIGLIKEAYETKDHYHLILEFEEGWLKFCAFTKILHVITYLTNAERSRTREINKQKPLLLTQKNKQSTKK